MVMTSIQNKTRHYGKWVAWGLAFIMAVGVFASFNMGGGWGGPAESGQPASSRPEVAFKVDGVPVSTAAYEQLADRYTDFYSRQPGSGLQAAVQARRSVLEQLKRQAATQKLAESLGVKVSRGEVLDEQDRLLMENFGERLQGLDAAERERAMAQFRAYGVTEEVARQQLIEKKLDEELTKKHALPKEEWLKQARQVRHILVMFQPSPDPSKPGAKPPAKRTEAETKARAMQIRERLLKGEDFAKVAKEVSEDPGSKDNGGAYPPFTKDNSPYVKEFTETTFKLKPGEISQPVRTTYGYHIMQLVPANNKPSKEETAKVDEAYQQYAEQKVGAERNKLVEEAVKKAKVEYVDPLVQGLALSDPSSMFSLKDEKAKAARRAEAIAALEKAVEDPNAPLGVQLELAELYKTAGQKEKQRALLEKLHAKDDRQYAVTVALAETYAEAADKKKNPKADPALAKRAAEFFDQAGERALASDFQTLLKISQGLRQLGRNDLAAKIDRKMSEGMRAQQSPGMGFPGGALTPQPAASTPRPADGKAGGAKPASRGKAPAGRGADNKTR